MSSIKIVAAYLRVSTLEQSTEIQSNEISRYIDSRGWTNLHLYEDKATGTNGNRPALKALLKDARERKFDVLVVWKLDRLFRSLKDMVITLQELSDLGVEFISLKDNIDLTTASGRLMMHLISAFAEFEASLIRERVRAGIKNAKEKGTRLGRPPMVDVTKVVSLRQQGLSLGKIAKQVGASKAAVYKILLKSVATKSVTNVDNTEGTSDSPSVNLSKG